MVCIVFVAQTWILFLSLKYILSFNTPSTCQSFYALLVDVLNGAHVFPSRSILFSLQLVGTSFQCKSNRIIATFIFAEIILAILLCYHVFQVFYFHSLNLDTWLIFHGLSVMLGAYQYLDFFQSDTEINFCMFKSYMHCLSIDCFLIILYLGWNLLLCWLCMLTLEAVKVFILCHHFHLSEEITIRFFFLNVFKCRGYILLRQCSKCFL